MHQTNLCLLYGLLIFIVSSCARIIAPEGGPRDEDPPILLKSTPHPNQLNYTGDGAVLHFNENILVEEARDKIIVSPPLQTPAVVKAYAKTLYIEFDDDEVLQANTAYTIDFADAIVDNNEKNALKDFSLSFSTGEVLDSLMISGNVLFADNLDPASGIVVGIYENRADSAFKTQVPLRVAKTASDGYFAIKNISPGSYRVFALADLNGDYKYDQPGEWIAFNDMEVIPHIDTLITPDTLWVDIPGDNESPAVRAIDSITQDTSVFYAPFDLVFHLFQGEFHLQSLGSRKRTDRKRLDFFFRGENSELPSIELIRPKLESNDNLWYIAEYNNTKDTISYWITDSTVYNSDSIIVAYNFLETDTSYQLVPALDTFTLVYKDPPGLIRQRERDQRKGIADSLPPLNIKLVGQSSTVNFFDSLKFESQTPIRTIDNSGVRLFSIKDSIETLIPDISIIHNLRKGYISANLVYGEQYKLVVDSASIIGQYGHVNKPIEKVFSTRPRESYAFISLEVLNAPDNFIVQILSPSDKVIDQQELEKGKKIYFQHLNPGVYYIRGFQDLNSDRQWTTGDYNTQRNPEPVSYYNNELQVKSNWDIEQSWDVQNTHTLLQKPNVLKNKIKRDGDDE